MLTDAHIKNKKSATEEAVNNRTGTVGLQGDQKHLQVITRWVTGDQVKSTEPEDNGKKPHIYTATQLKHWSFLKVLHVTSVSCEIRLDSPPTPELRDQINLRISVTFGQDYYWT